MVEGISRKLAREFHPDVAKDKKKAEEKFKEINEAYEVLSDPDKRRKYDELGANWKSGSEFRPPPGYGGFGGGQPFRGGACALGPRHFEKIPQIVPIQGAESACAFLHIRWAFSSLYCG